MTPDEKHQKLQEFLVKWPKQKVEDMKVSDYCLGRNNYKDTLTYWVEKETKALGQIGGIGGGGSFKFGIFYKDEIIEYKIHKNFKSNGEFGWDADYGDTPIQAFETIKNRILQVIDYSITGNIDLIDNIQLHNLPKWKIAFLYSDQRLLPIYDLKVLRAIAESFGIGTDSTSISFLMQYIMSKKPDQLDLFIFADQLYDEFGRNAAGHYLVGSKYRDEEDKYIDIFPEMFDKNIVAVGFGADYDLEHLYGLSHDEITSFLYKKGESTSSVTALKQFLSLKPGDLVAIKHHGRFGNLKIRAYAKVIVDKDGKVYRHDPNGLGHLINVEFLEVGLDLAFDLNKGHTLHRIDDPTEIKLLFGAYAWIRDRGSKANKKQGRKGVEQKSVETQLRTINRTIEVQMIHNKMQQAFYDNLKSTQNKNGFKVEMEVDFIDVKLTGPSAVTYYEVKPYHSPTRCIREGLGQVLSYACSDNHSKEKKIVIVGPNSISESDQQYYNYIKENLDMSFEYEAFTFE